MAVTELFVEKDINLYIYVYISFAAPLGGPSREVLVVLTSCCHWGRQNFKEDHLSSCASLCRCMTFAFVRHICAFLQFQMTSTEGDTVSYPRCIDLSRCIFTTCFRRNLNYFILFFVSRFDCVCFH